MILLQIFKNRKGNGDKSLYYRKELKRKEIGPSFNEKSIQISKHSMWKKCCTRLSVVLLLIRQEEFLLVVKSSQKTTVYFIQSRLNFYSSILVPRNANIVTSAGQL